MIFLSALLSFFILIIIFSSAKDRQEDKKQKAITDVSIKLIFGIFLSIILSVLIAVNADIPPSAGHGFYIWIIGPGLMGLMILLFYLTSLIVKPQQKYILGLTSIFLNVFIGFYFMLSSF